VVSDRGLLQPDAVQAQLRPPGFGTVVTKAVAVENTHNRGGGAVYPYEQLVALRAITAEAGVALHCDGARIWNASIASGVALGDYGSLFDTMSVCLSKGLGAPVGSVLLASADQVAQARVLRKRLGGGMRQAGILAAAGIYALEHNIERLADDHRRAQWLAAELSSYGVTDPAAVDTNVVVLDLRATSWSAAELSAAAREQGVLASVVGPQRMRLLTHLDVDDDGCALAAKVLAGLLT
jgi:threonine aldolase